MNKYRVKLIIPSLYFLGAVFICYLELALRGLNTTRLIGLVIIVAGFILWIMARIQLADSFSIKAEARKLVTSGLYRKIRHPVYFFSSLVLLGLTIFYTSP